MIPPKDTKLNWSRFSKRLKDAGGISQQQYWHLYPTSEDVPKFYGLPKIHKQGTPLRPIISGIGTITYNTAKFCAKIISPLVGKSDYHIKNTQDLVQKVQNLKLDDDDEMVSYDVTALFTSVPVEAALTVIHERLLTDTTLHERTDLNPDQITELLRFVLTASYCTFQNVFYRQCHGASMGSPCSPLTADFFMEWF